MPKRGERVTPEQVAEFVALMLARWCPHQVGGNIDAIVKDGTYLIRRLMELDARSRRRVGRK